MKKNTFCTDFGRIPFSVPPVRDDGYYRRRGAPAWTSPPPGPLHFRGCILIGVTGTLRSKCSAKFCARRTLIHHIGVPLAMAIAGDRQCQPINFRSMPPLVVARIRLQTAALARILRAF